MYVRSFPASKLRDMFTHYPGRPKRAHEPGHDTNTSNVFPIHEYINASLDRLDGIVAENINATVHLAVDLTTSLPQTQVEHIRPIFLNDRHAVNKLQDSNKFAHYGKASNDLTFPTFVLPLSMSVYGCYSYLTEKFIDHLIIKNATYNYALTSNNDDLYNDSSEGPNRREMSFRRNAWNNLSRIYFNSWYQGLLYNPWRYNSRNARNYSAQPSVTVD